MSAAPKPDVFDFLDLVSYLKRYYEYRKAAEKSFSYESWSQELEFNTSRSFLRMIVTGQKKASPLFVDSFCRRNFSNPQEEEYFHFLVKYSQASSAKDRQAFGNRLIQIIKTRSQPQAVRPQEDFTSSPLLPRLMTLVSFQDVTPTLETYARLLNLPPETVQQALEKLEELGLIERTLFEGQVLWRALARHFKVPDQKGSFQLMRFHEKSLQDAIGAFHLPKELRSYKSLFLALSEEDLQTFSRLLSEFSAEQLSRFTPDLYEGKRIFQMNINIHAVSEPMSVGESPRARGGK